MRLIVVARLFLSQINIFPVKSAAGISMKTATVTDRGIAHDRRWMLVDRDHRFLSQRKFPRMTLISAKILQNHLHINAPGQKELKIPLSGCTGRKTSVNIWSDICSALLCDPEADEWFSRFLEQQVHLVYMPDNAGRLTDPLYGENQSPVSFADGYPFLLISEASLTDLNKRLSVPLEMSRFRPNLVVSGCAPYEEDRWRLIRIGDITFEVVKPCSRCTITTVNPDTAETNKEPLKTLATYRKAGSKVYFGQNLIHINQGVLTTGMEFQILKQVIKPF
jgi:hypothetical protein